MATHYDLLGVKPDATAEEIKRAYRKRARAVHPDVNPGAEDMFALINEAYEVLGDELSRAAYDRELKGEGGYSGNYSSSAPPPPPPPPPFTHEEQGEWGTETSWEEDHSWGADTESTGSATPPWEEGYFSERVRGWQPDEEEDEEKEPLTKRLWEATKRGWQYILDSPYKHFFLVALFGAPVTLAAAGITGYRTRWLLFLVGVLLLAFLGNALGGRSWRRLASGGIYLVQGALLAAGFIVQMAQGEPSVWWLIAPVMGVIAITHRAVTKNLAKQAKHGGEPEVVRTTEVGYYQH